MASCLFPNFYVPKGWVRNGQSKCIRHKNCGRDNITWNGKVAGGTKDKIGKKKLSCDLVIPIHASIYKFYSKQETMELPFGIPDIFSSENHHITMYIVNIYITHIYMFIYHIMMTRYLVEHPNYEMPKNIIHI